MFKSGRLALPYFEYVKTLFGSILSQNIENQQITSPKYTVIAHSHVRPFQQAGISTDAQDRRDLRKQRQDKTVNLLSRIDVSGSSQQL